MNKQKIGYIATVIFSFIFVFCANKIATINYVSRDQLANGVPEKMVVTQILDTDYSNTLYGDDSYGRSEHIVLFKAKFTSGYKKGTEVEVIQRTDTMYAVEMRKVSVGDKIVAYLNPDTTIDVKYMFAEFHRVDFLIYLIIALCVLILLFGRSKGANTLISLGFTIAAIFYVFIPAVLSNGNIYLWAIITSVFIIFMTLLLVCGYTKKSLAAIIGCFTGVSVSGILTLVADKFVHMTGLVNEDSMYLLLLDENNPIDIKAVIFAAIIIGAIGAVMDVAMSIASSLEELKTQVGTMSAAQITRSGLVIGRDIMGTMANTLVLAYIGSSLSVTLLLVAYNSSKLLLFNTEMIIVELLQTIAGSFGILLTIPLTSIICGFLYADKEKAQQKYKDD